MSYYAQTYTSERYEAERQQKQAVADRFKALALAQATITVRLEILTRNGKSKASLGSLKEAEEAYARAYADILDAAPIAQKAIPSR